MVPECFSAYRRIMPRLEEVAEWTLLRKWALSEVYRATWKSGQTSIIKWAAQEMARESAIYRQLVIPMQIKAPCIFNLLELETDAVMIMEDVGRQNLEQQPLPYYLLEAARELARLRKVASANLEAQIPSETISSYTVSAANFITLLDDLLESPRLSKSCVLSRLRKTLPSHLEKLYRTLPLTLVHHDFHAKNLMIQGNGILPIDWSLAYLSPHLGDLHCLVNEAKAWCCVSQDNVLSAFLQEAGTELSMEQLNWQVKIGGLCWLIKTLRWLVYGGTVTIPDSDAWIPDLMNDLEDLMKDLV